MPKITCYDCNDVFRDVKEFDRHCEEIHVAVFKDTIARFCVANDPSSRTMAALGPSVLNLDAHFLVKAILLAMARDCDQMFVDALREATIPSKRELPYEWYIDVCPDDIVDPDMYDSDDIDSDDSGEVFRYAEVRALSSRMALFRAVSNSCWSLASSVTAVLHYKEGAHDWLTRCVINHLYHIR